MVTLRRCGAGIARNATALVSVRCTVHVRYTEAPYVYSVHTLHDVIGVQPCIGWDHLAPSPGVDPAAGDRFIHRTPILRSKIYKTRGKGPTDGGHTGTEKRSTRRSTQTDTPGPAAATPTWNNTGPGWTGGGPDTPATDEAGGPLGGAATTTSKASLESRRGTGGRAS